MVVKGPDRKLLLEAVAVLGELSEAFRLRRESLAASVGLSEGQWSLLEEVSTEHFMPSMFAKSRSSSAAAVSKSLRQLKEKGLVVAAHSVKDGRQRDYELTAAGKKILSALRAERETAIRTIWEPLEPKALEAFAAFGKALVARLDAYEEKRQGGL